MITKYIASTMFNIKEKCIKRFDVTDIFNEPNTLGGWISLKPDSTYGSIIIDTVNNEATFPQYKFCMPKLRYPFSKLQDGSRKYTWASDWTEVIITEKWDGTNIVEYQYMDAKLNKFTTYKTRLTPIAGNSELFGNFGGMLKEIFARPEAPQRFPSMRDNHVYELCGFRNPHLVKYDFDIKLIPICIISQNKGEIKPVNHLSKIIRSKIEIDLTKEYTNSQEDDNNIILDSGKEEGELPLEGKVFYVNSKSQGYIPVKCKPAIIEEIHFARGGIGSPILKATCLKALEAYPIAEIDVAKIEGLLAEDYIPEAIKCSKDRIIVALNELKSEAIMRNNIKDYILSLGLELVSYHKKVIMPLLSKNFHRSDMRKVFNSARAMGLVTTE